MIILDALESKDYDEIKEISINSLHTFYKEYSSCSSKEYDTEYEIVKAIQKFVRKNDEYKRIIT